MWLLILSFITCYVVPFNLGLFNLTVKQKTTEDYYLNYDYELSNNFSEDDNLDLQSDSLIFPNPKLVEAGYTIDILPKVELPDDSLADSDLRDHDFIDNLMYVYYGSHNRMENSYGSEIIIIGSVLSCAAQVLTILCVLLKKTLNGRKKVGKLFLHLMCCLCLSNLIFMAGVHSTKSFIKCQIVAIVLHYLYMLTAVWIFMYCSYIYNNCIKKLSPNLAYLLAITYGFPGGFTIVTFLLAPKSYETNRFCFVSVQKGMIIDYMLPVSILIIATTIFALNGIRKVNLELTKLEMTSEAESLNMLRNELDISDNAEKKSDMPNEEITYLRECKNCLKVLCVLQTSYNVVWFTAVLALENITYSSVMPVSYTLFSLLMNWYIFAKSKSFLPAIIYNGLGNVIEIDIEGEKSTSCFTKNSADNIPLLVSTEVCTEIHELCLDTISTISN